MSVSGPGALATANVGYFSEPPNRWRRFFLFFLFAHSCVNVCVAFYIGTRVRNFKYADGVCLGKTAVKNNLVKIS